MALIVAAAVTGTPVAYAESDVRGEGSDGSFSVAIAVAGDGRYEVSVAVLNAHPEVTASSVDMEVVDEGGTRSFHNPYPGGQIRDTLAFDNRGPCTVRIIFRFTGAGGQEQSNATRPVTVSYPSAGPAPDPYPSDPGVPGNSRVLDNSRVPDNGGVVDNSGVVGDYQPSGDGAADCVTPTGMTALLDQDTSDSQRPWKRPAGSRVTVNFVTDGSITPEWRSDLEHGAEVWNKSPCIDARVVDACPEGGNCVSVSALDKMDADGNFDAVEKDGFTTGGKLTLLNKLNQNQRRNVAAHEMGHAIGLVHRRTNHILMNAETFDDVFDPDQTDYNNLLFSYDRMQRSP